MRWVHTGVNHRDNHSRSGGIEAGMRLVHSDQLRGRLRHIAVPHGRAVVRNRLLVGQIRRRRVRISLLRVHLLIDFYGKNARLQA